MKRHLYFLLLTVAVTLGFTAHAQQVQTGPKISFTKQIHDYGTLRYGANGQCTFEFTNTGNAPLIISDAKGSCNCTVPEWPKEPIPPGGKGKIIVKYDTKKSGPINKSVTITSNATNEAVVMLRIKGFVTNAPTDGAPAEPVNPPFKTKS